MKRVALVVFLGAAIGGVAVLFSLADPLFFCKGFSRKFDFSLYANGSKEPSVLAGEQRAALCSEKNVALHVDISQKIVRQQDFLPAGETFAAQIIDERLQASEGGRRLQVVSLVNKGIEAIQKKPLKEALHDIVYSRELKHGDLYLYVVNTKGVVLAHGEDISMIWTDWYDSQDELGNYLVRNAIESALHGDGWSMYYWKRVPKTVYSRAVEKDGQQYVIICGYFPLSKKDFAEGLVRTAAATFNSLLQSGHSEQVVFGVLGYPLGKFVYGDLYLYAFDEQGVIRTHGRNPARIGENLLDVQDAGGDYFFRDIIDQLRLKPVGTGVWVEYIWYGAIKISYAQRVVSAQGKSFFIVCGYHPDATERVTVDLVRRGINYLTVRGKEHFFQRMLDRQTFIHGDLYLVVYDKKGICIADAQNSDLIGRNQMGLRDDDGRFMVKEILAQAQVKNSGWVGFKVKNAFLNIYFEKQFVGQEPHVICCGLFPVSEQETTILLARYAARHFEAHAVRAALYDFSTDTDRFSRGFSRVFVLDTRGVCYVWGGNNDLVWQNLYNSVDDVGTHYIQNIICEARRGGRTLFSQELNARKVYNFSPVVKNGKTYVVGSSSFVS